LEAAAGFPLAVFHAVFLPVIINETWYKTVFSAAMRQARQLTREQNVIEAKCAIKRALSGRGRANFARLTVARNVSIDFAQFIEDRTQVAQAFFDGFPVVFS
jgi:hypothetical protein